MAKTARTGYCNGSDMLVYVGGKAVGHCTTHTATFASETKDRAVKPVASATLSAGLWKQKGVVGLSISISAEDWYTTTKPKAASKSCWPPGRLARL